MLTLNLALNKGDQMDLGGALSPKASRKEIV
jgi:hypothetical protein